MTVQVHTAGPGVEAFRSTRFAATVNGTSAYVYSRSRTTEYTVPGFWLEGTTIEVSAFTYGADETTTVVVSLVSGSITSAVVYPKAHGITAVIGGGTATITVTVPNLHKPLRVEVNGDPANVLYIHPHALKTAAPGGAVVFDGTQMSVPDGTSLRFPAGFWDLTDAMLSSWGDKLFPVGSNTTVYFDEGSVVRGTFDLRTGTAPGDGVNSNISFRGPGLLIGDFILNEDLPTTFEEQHPFSMFYGYDAGFASSGNSIREMMVMQSPFYTIGGHCMNHIEDFHVYNPWTDNCDGFKAIGDVNDANRYRILNCSAWCGDDCLDVQHYARHGIIDGLFLAASGSAAIMLGYQSPDIDYGWETQITNVWVRAICDYYLLPDGKEGGAVIQCWVDETIAGAALGHGRYRVSINGLIVEGDDINCVLFSIRNKLYPWGTSKDERGNIAQFTIANVTTESVPAERSKLIGYDADNTPHDIVFTNITIAGIPLTQENWSEYVEQNQFPYNITIDAAETPGEPAEEEDEDLEIVEAIEQQIAQGAGVRSYTVNGETVNLASLDEQIRAHKYFEQQRAKSQGLRRTRVGFRR